MRMYSNYKSASKDFYGADYYTNSADYIKDPYSENRHNLFPLWD